MFVRGVMMVRLDFTGLWWIGVEYDIRVCKLVVLYFIRVSGLLENLVVLICFTVVCCFKLAGV